MPGNRIKPNRCKTCLRSEVDSTWVPCSNCLDAWEDNRELVYWIEGLPAELVKPSAYTPVLMALQQQIINLIQAQSELRNRNNKLQSALDAMQSLRLYGEERGAERAGILSPLVVDAQGGVRLSEEDRIELRKIERGIVWIMRHGSAENELSGEIVDDILAGLES